MTQVKKFKDYKVGRYYTMNGDIVGDWDLCVCTKITNDKSPEISDGIAYMRNIKLESKSDGMFFGPGLVTEYNAFEINKIDDPEYFL